MEYQATGKLRRCVTMLPFKDRHIGPKIVTCDDLWLQDRHTLTSVRAQKRPKCDDVTIIYLSFPMYNKKEKEGNRG
jgi:hypothetical protein